MRLDIIAFRRACLVSVAAVAAVVAVVWVRGGSDKIIWVNFKGKGETDLMLESFTFHLTGHVCNNVVGGGLILN